MTIAINLILGLTTVLTAAYALVLRNKLKQTSKNLKEMIKENDGQQSNPAKTNGDVYFKINKDFAVTFINESGADVLGHLPAQLMGKPVFGTLLEDKTATRELMESILSKMCRNQSTINTQIVIIKGNGQKQIMQCRARPLLNEILECEGVSLLCQDISEAKAWQENLSQFQNRDLFISGLNEQALLERYEHDFQLAKRYNKAFSLVMVELKDVYDFIAHGIDFETADKMLKVVSDVCFNNLTPNAHIGRVDKTKIVMVLNNTSQEKAQIIAEKIMKESTPVIRRLGIDEYNAQMISVVFGERRNCNDSEDVMWTRFRRRIKAALRQRIYGVISSDSRPSLSANHQ